METSTSADEIVSTASGRVGQVLCGRWRIDALLGVGGLSSTYSATHRGGKRFGIRVLQRRLLSTQLANIFVEQAYVANRIDHPAIVSVIDDDLTEHGEPFVVMELLEGETVEQRWARSGNRLALIEVLWICDQVLDVLSVAHAAGIPHGRLRAANLFFTRQSALRVMDFGVAPLRGEGADLGIDARGDLRAVGAMMRTLLSGGLIASTTTDSACPELPPPVEHLIDTALSRDAAHAELDARAFRGAVRSAIETAIRASRSHPPGDEDRPTLNMAPSQARAQLLSATLADAVAPASPTEMEDEPSVEVTSAEDSMDDRMAETAFEGQPRGFRRAKPLPVDEPASVRPSGATGARLIFATELAYVYFQRAMQREETGDHEGAIGDYTKAIDRLPTHALAHYNRGVARQAIADYLGAIDDYLRALELQDDLAEAHYNIALARHEIGERVIAHRHANLALVLYRERADEQMTESAAALVEWIEQDMDGAGR